MNKATFDAMLAQYAVKEASGDGAVSWDGGVRCVLPEVLISGKAVQNGTPTPDVPIMPEFSGGTEVVSRGNLADIPDIVSQAYTVDMSAFIQWYIDLPVGATITVAADAYCPYGAGGASSGWRIVLRDEDEPIIRLFNGYAETPQRLAYTHTKSIDFTFADVAYTLWYLGYGFSEYDRWVKNITVSIGKGDPGYIPYFDGGTAVAPKLLAIPGTEYRDEWDAQTGKGVRRVGKLVLDGTETWNVASGDFPFFYCVLSIASVSPYVGGYSHGIYTALSASIDTGSSASVYDNGIFRIRGPETITTVDAWKEWLAAQYAAGTPVTVWYALKEPIEFETDPQPLIAPKGTGHIMQVGGTLDAVPITAKYVTHS